MILVLFNDSNQIRFHFCAISIFGGEIRRVAQCGYGVWLRSRRFRDWRRLVMDRRELSSRIIITKKLNFQSNSERRDGVHFQTTRPSVVIFFCFRFNSMRIWFRAVLQSIRGSWNCGFWAEWGHDLSVTRNYSSRGSIILRRKKKEKKSKEKLRKRRKKTNEKWK